MNIYLIILLCYVAFVVLGTLVQFIVYATKIKHKDGLFDLILIFFIFLIFNFLVSPFCGFNCLLRYQRKPIPNKFTIWGYNEDIRIALLGLGFNDIEERLSTDNIPYKGFRWVKNFDNLILCVFDNNEQILRVSIYKKTEETKYISEQLKRFESLFLNK